MNNWDKIKFLFKEAVELSPEGREVFLNEKCKDDPSLRKEIESLIESDQKVEDFLENPLIETKEFISGENSADPFIGLQLGKYRVEKKIGEGGMAVVYSAVRTDEQFKKKVAIKFIKRGMDTDEIIKRFKIEQQALAGLDHPLIAKIIDGGTTDNGLPYFIMELVEGEAVDKYCVSKNLSITKKLELFRKICSAVQYAHQNLIVHRDIKPGNIFVKPDGTPKLLDFGISKLLDSSNDQTILTRTGFRLMTLEYASPEQFKGGQITIAADIYSLGVVLYELLTGNFPYKFKSSLPNEIERLICTTEPAKPSSSIGRFDEDKLNEGNKILSNEQASAVNEKDYKRIKRRLTGDIDNIVLKAMQKDPARRYSTVEQFSEDIRRHLTGLPVIARKNSLRYRSKKFIERHRAGVITSFIFFLVVVAGAIGILLQSKVAEDERDKAQIEAVKVNKINSFLQDMLSSADPTQVGKDVKVVDVLDKASKKIDSELKAQPEVAAELKTTIGITYENLGIYDKAEVQLKQALQIRQSLFGENNDKTASSINNLAGILHSEGELDRAKKLYEKAIEIHRRFPKPKHVELADALNNCGILNLDLGNYDESIKYFNEAYAIYLEVYGKQNDNTAALITNLALSYHYKGDLKSAEGLYREALNISYKLPGNVQLQIAHETNDLAFLLHDKGDHKGALELFEKSLEIREKILGKNHPGLGLAIFNMGTELYYLKDYSGSLKKINEAYKIWQKSIPADHPYFAKVYYWFGKLYNEKGLVEKAKSYLLKSLSLRLKKQPDNRLLIAETRFELGRTYFLQKNYIKANSLLLKNFNILKEELGKKNIETINDAMLLSELYLKLQRPDEANKYKTYLSE